MKWVGVGRKGGKGPGREEFGRIPGCSVAAETNGRSQSITLYYIYSVHVSKFMYIYKCVCTCKSPKIYTHTERYNCRDFMYIVVNALHSL